MTIDNPEHPDHLTAHGDFSGFQAIDPQLKAAEYNPVITEETGMNGPVIVDLEAALKACGFGPVAEHDDAKCVRSVGDCEDCAAIAAGRLLVKAEEALDKAMSEEVPTFSRTMMVDAARAYMELADRHL